MKLTFFYITFFHPASSVISVHAKTERSNQNLLKNWFNGFEHGCIADTIQYVLSALFDNLWD